MIRNKISAIQALRGIAAIFVVIRHSWWSFRLGGSGVDLFFIISGFTMVYSSQNMFGSAKSAYTFITRRFIRIFPAYWAATIILILLLGLPDYLYLIRSLFLVTLPELPMLAPGWTLSFELCFYLIFAMFIFLPMARAVFAIVSVLLLLVFVGQLVPSVGLYASPLVLEFGLGSLIGLAFCKGARVGKWPAMLLLLAGLVGLAASVSLGELADKSWLRQIWWGLPSACIVIALVFGPEIKLLQHNIFQELGDASYSIYVAHWIIVRGFHSAPHHRPATFLMSIFAGVGFYYVFEKPVLQFLRARLAASSAKAPAEPVYGALSTSPAVEDAHLVATIISLDLNHAVITQKTAPATTRVGA
jgi:exopolysaccharide production protein ExoZ